MNEKRGPMAFLGSTLFAMLAFAGGPATADCYPEHAATAEVVASQLKDWRGVYGAFVRHGMCDDGAVAEGFSDSIAKILSQRWDTVTTLNRLSRKNAKFRKFVLRHIDSLMSPQQARAISEKARKHCPRGVGDLCAEIAARVDNASHG